MCETKNRHQNMQEHGENGLHLQAYKQPTGEGKLYALDRGSRIVTNSYVSVPWSTTLDSVP